MVILMNRGEESGYFRTSVEQSICSRWLDVRGLDLAGLHAGFNQAGCIWAAFQVMNSPNSKLRTDMLHMK